MSFGSIKFLRSLIQMIINILKQSIKLCPHCNNLLLDLLLHPSLHLQHLSPINLTDPFINDAILCLPQKLTQQ